MHHFGHCPRCNEAIPADRQFGPMIVCKCGWSVSAQADIAERRDIDRTCVAIIAAALLLVGAFIHGINWDRHSLTIIPLKIAQFSKTASRADLYRIAEICEERAKPGCMAEAYNDIYRLDPTEISVLVPLGRVHALTGNREAASLVYSRYFSSGGKDLDAAFEYARILGQTGQVAESRRYFEYVIQGKPDRLQISVTKAYVEMLVQNRRLEEARSLITNFRKKSVNAIYFLDRELKEINKQLGMKS